MAARKSKSTRIDVPEELKGLWKEIAEIDAQDKEAVVRIGIRLEQSWTTLRVNGDDKADLDLLKGSLKALQKLYQDEMANADVVWNVVSEAIRAVEDKLGGNEGAIDEILNATEHLDSILASGGQNVEKPASKVAAASETNATGSSSSADFAKPLEAIEGVSAKLLGLGPDDIEDLTKLRDTLVEISGSAHLAGGAIGHLTLAMTQMEMVLNGQGGEAGQRSLAEAARILGQAADVQEAWMKKQASEAAPAEEVPVEATDSSESSSEPAGIIELDEPEPEAAIELEEPEPEVVEPAPAPTPEPKPKAEPKSSSTPSDVKAKPKTTVEFEGPAILPEDSDMELLNEYIIESLDHISNSEGALLDLESNPENREKIDVVFRAFHTIKGTSGFLGFDRIQKLAHLAENMLDRARDGEIKIMGGYADLSLRSCDCLRTMLEGLQGVQPGGALAIPEDLPDLLSILSDPEGAGYTDTSVGEEAQSMRVGEILVGKGEVSRRAVEKAEKTKGDKKLGEKLIEDKVVKPKQVAEAIRTQKQQQQTQAAAENSVRVTTERLDNLINMVGELVIAQSMVAADPAVATGSSPRLQRSVSHAGKIIRELQDLTMSLRMVPLKAVFQKMNRLVRDLARKSGKLVQFITEGEDTEIDRNMVESLNDPLVHMIRNSVDHGIETAEDRIAIGKEGTGTVCLRAYHAAGNVVIELQDDGKGLNREKILAKAAEKGVIEKGKELSDQETFLLIFAPGFSTADKVTDVSGRGVGMDVVKRNIESLRGRIEVTSKPNRGSTFTVRLPLTMAITDAMILRVGEDRYLLPTVSIEQSFQPEHGSISTVTGDAEMVMLRGELLPIFRLHELFSIEGAMTDPYEGLLIVIEGDGKRCALMVDELLGQQQVVIKSLGQGIAKVPGVSGGAILGDGRVGLILDATGILQLAEGRSEYAEMEGAMM